MDTSHNLFVYDWRKITELTSQHDFSFRAKVY